MRLSLSFGTRERSPAADDSALLERCSYELGYCYSATVASAGFVVRPEKSISGLPLDTLSQLASSSARRMTIFYRATPGAISFTRSPRRRFYSREPRYVCVCGTRAVLSTLGVLRILAVDNEPSVLTSLRFVFGFPRYDLTTVKGGEGSSRAARKDWRAFRRHLSWTRGCHT
jgi:hypothetical protein